MCRKTALEWGQESIMGGGGEGGVKKKRVPGNDADASFELK